MRPDEILADVAVMYDVRDLHKGSFTPDDTRLDPDTCPLDVLAAINVAVGLEPDAEPNRVASDAAHALADWLGIDPDACLIESLGAWNDRPEQTRENVAMACRKCAAELVAVGAR